MDAHTALMLVPMKLIALPVAMILLASGHARGAGDNLLANGDFADKEPLRGWLVAFPDEAFYKDNAPYVKLAKPGEANGRRAIVLDLPAGIAGNQGGKIESVPVPVVAGGKYRVDVDCMTWDFSAKIHAESWTTDPHPDQKRTIFRRAPADGRPAMIMCHRAQVPSPPGNAKSWSTAGREFTVPAKVVVAGQEKSPEFISVKVVAYGATMNAGKSYFSNFRLVRVDGAADAKQP